jgi:glycerol kinase
MTAKVMLAIDEGTSGTRAALVDVDGTVFAQQYRPLRPPRAAGRVVELDADEIWSETLDSVRAVLAIARSDGLEVAGIAISNQRATSVLWDGRTGRALVPAMGWQDTRFTERLAAEREEWEPRLLVQTGRPIGSRSSLLWATDHLASSPAVVSAHNARQLRFGTIETWLIWKLTGGASYVTTATNLGATGAYHLRSGGWAREWTEHLGVPDDILPAVASDGSHLGETDRAVLGERLPILAAMGDQLAGMIGLGVIDAGEAACIHGTGSFVDVLVGPVPPATRADDESALTVLARDDDGRRSFSVESYTPATGSALNWLCGTAGLFASGEEISARAAEAADAGGVTFVPALTGMHNPVESPASAGSLTGLRLGVSRDQLARAVLDGIANATADSAEAAGSAAGLPISHIRAGGGISASDVLLQLQADLIGVPVLRVAGAQVASLRGAAFLGGSRGALWEGLEDAVATVRPAAEFLPLIPDADRQARRSRWGFAVKQEVERANSLEQRSRRTDRTN